MVKAGKTVGSRSMTMRALIEASIAVARNKCNNDTNEADGCGEKWCSARSKVRKALDSMGIAWKEETAPTDKEDGA